MRVGSGLANGLRQYAVTVTTTWQQLESGVSGYAVGDNGLALGLPVLRWKGQAGTSATLNTNNYDYPQGVLIQNRDASATLYVSTTKDADGTDPSTGTARSVANAIAVAAGASIRLDATDASKVWLAGSGTLVAAILAN
jgi:hypothetical protein